MSGLLLDNYLAAVDSTEKESGDKSCPIWLFFNPKASSVFYDIWNPVLDGIQDKVYRELRKRIDKQRIYIRNVASDIGVVSKSFNACAAEVGDDLKKVEECVLKYRPKMIITFGSLTYELVNRFLETNSANGLKYWNSTNLGVEFDRAIASFDINHINRIPLPRRIKSCYSADSAFSTWEDGEPYFRDVAAKIATKIIENQDCLDIWID